MRAIEELKQAEMKAAQLIADAQATIQKERDAFPTVLEALKMDENQKVEQAKKELANHAETEIQAFSTRLVAEKELILSDLNRCAESKKHLAIQLILDQVVN